MLKSSTCFLAPVVLAKGMKTGTHTHHERLSLWLWHSMELYWHGNRKWLFLRHTCFDSKLDMCKEVISLNILIIKDWETSTLPPSGKGKLHRQSSAQTHPTLVTILFSLTIKLLCIFCPHISLHAFFISKQLSVFNIIYNSNPNLLCLYLGFLVIWSIWNSSRGKIPGYF